MPSFEDLNLRDELLHTLEEEGIWTPTAVQEAVIPALRRGGNLIARASSGSGKTLAYTLGILDRIDPERSGEEVSCLAMIVVATAEEAERIALSLVPYAQSLGLQVAAGGPAWGTSLAAAEIIIAVPGNLLEAVQRSGLKLDDVQSVVIDGASAMVELGQWEQVDALIDLLPREAQRVLFSPATPLIVEDLIARRVKRALRYPPEPAVPEQSGRVEVTETISFVMAAEREKLDLLSRQLRQQSPDSSPAILFFRNDERAADIAEQLTVRGFVVGAPDDADADVTIAAAGVSRDQLAEDIDAALGQTISFDVPADVEELRRRHSAAPDAVILIEPRELAHLEEITRRGGFRAQPGAVPSMIATALADLHAFRRELRKAMSSEDLTAQMLVLEPLFEEFTAAEVAAAATALLRRRVAPAQPEEAIAPTLPATAPSKPAGPPPPTTWTRLFVGVGSRDEVRPGDLVGALAGEADIPGSRIGKIDIRENFSIVEVESPVAEKVIQAVNGTTIKGRSVRVDFDRGGPAHRPPGRGAAPARRATRRPPRESS